MGDGDRGKSTFDPYYTWLGIPPSVPRPPNHYVLLGLPAFESDPNMIASFADKQMTFVQTFKTGPHSAVSQQILNELAQARITLLNPQRRAAYDEQLRATLAAAAPPVAVPAAAPSVASIPPSFEFGLPFPAGEATSLPTPARKPPVGGTRAASIPLPIMAGVGVGVVAALLAVAVIVAAGQPKRNAVGVAIVESTVTRAVTATPEPPSASPESPTPRAAVPSPAPLPKPKFAARVVADPEVQLTGEPAAGMSAQPEPTAAAPSAPPAVDPPAVLVETPAIDLLKTLPLDAVERISGKATVTPERIEFEPSHTARLQVPAAIDGRDYVLSMRLTRLSGEECAIVMLPVGKAACTLVLNGWTRIGAKSFLSRIDDVKGCYHPEAVPGAIIDRGIPYDLDVAVSRVDEQKHKIAVRLNGKELFTTIAADAALTPEPDWVPRNANLLGLGAHESRFLFENLRLRFVEIDDVRGRN